MSTLSRTDELRTLPTPELFRRRTLVLLDINQWYGRGHSGSPKRTVFIQEIEREIIRRGGYLSAADPAFMGGR